MEKIKVSEADVLNTLQAVVDERPDYVYARPAHMPADLGLCRYVHTAEGDPETRTPGCLVGQVLSRLGIPLEELQKHEGSGATNVTPLFIYTTGRAVDILQGAQDNQDGGDAWGEALSGALDDYPADDYAA